MKTAFNGPVTPKNDGEFPVVRRNYGRKWDRLPG